MIIIFRIFEMENEKEYIIMRLLGCMEEHMEQLELTERYYQVLFHIYL